METSKDEQYFIVSMSLVLKKSKASFYTLQNTLTKKEVTAIKL